MNPVRGTVTTHAFFSGSDKRFARAFEPPSALRVIDMLTAFAMRQRLVVGYSVGTMRQLGRHGYGESRAESMKPIIGAISSRHFHAHEIGAVPILRLGMRKVYYVSDYIYHFEWVHR